MTRAARFIDQGTAVERTRRSRSENHSGLVAKEMSCTVITIGHDDHNGAVYVTCSTST